MRLLLRLFSGVVFLGVASVLVQPSLIGCCIGFISRTADIGQQLTTFVWIAICGHSRSSRSLPPEILLINVLGLRKATGTLAAK